LVKKSKQFHTTGQFSKRLIKHFHSNTGRFATLESKLQNLQRRKMFGFYDPETDEYRACVALADTDKDSFG